MWQLKTDSGAMSPNARVARREFVRTALGMLAVAPLAARTAFAQDAGRLTDRIEFRQVVAANRIRRQTWSRGRRGDSD